MSDDKKKKKKKKHHVEAEAPAEQAPKKINERSCEALAQRLNAKHGARTVRRGDEMDEHVSRLPAGIFMITYMTGGGYPIGRMTRIKGPEGGGKTGLAINAMKMTNLMCWNCFNMLSYCTCSRPSLKMKSLYNDCDGTLDRPWVENIGVPPDAYYVPEADDGGEYLDIINEYLKADDCGFVVIDSVARLIPPDEMGRAVGDRKIGTQAQLMTDAVQKIGNTLNREAGRGHPVVLMALNELRYKVGVMFGSPESESGGQSFRHWSVLGLRSSKATSDKEEDNYGDTKRDTKFAQPFKVRRDRFKVWTLLGSANYTRVIDDFPEDPPAKKKKEKKGQLFEGPQTPEEETKAAEDGEKKKKTYIPYRTGEITDFKLVIQHATDSGVLIKDGGKYFVPEIFEEGSPTLWGFLQEMRKNQDLYYQLHVEIVNAERRKRFGK